MRLPGPFRAAVGLVASASDEARHLPDRAIELPMLAVSTALQLSLRAQQRYARLAARGDAVLNRSSRPSEDPPPWATFDDPVSVEDLRRGVFQDEDGSSDPDLGSESSRLLQDIFGVDDPDGGTAPPVNGTPKPAAKKPPAKAGEGKSVSKPRHTPPSAFDNASDDD